MASTEFFPYSPAFRWGLIEASRAIRMKIEMLCIPRHFAGASLKP